MAIQLLEAIWDTSDKDNVNKNTLTYVAKNELNQTVNRTISKGDPEFDTTIEKLGGPEAIDQFTERKQQADLKKVQQAQDMQSRIDKLESNLTNFSNSEMSDEEKKAEKLKTLFTKKLEAFEIEEVKNSENRELRSRIRKSTSEIEISAIVSLIMAENIFSKKKITKKKTTTKAA